MKILVMSDSHGELNYMITAIEDEHPDYVFFLGDHERDAWDLSRLYPKIPVCAVRGNCDWGGGQDQWVIELENVRFMLTHGHLYGVKTGLSQLCSAGEAAGADVVCFGHTHCKLNTVSETGVLLFNPGAVGGSRGQRVTYGIIYASNGKVTTEIKEII